MRHRSVQLVKSYDANNNVNEYRQTETVDGFLLSFSVKDEAVSNGKATQLRLEEFVGAFTSSPNLVNVRYKAQ